MCPHCKNKGEKRQSLITKKWKCLACGYEYLIPTAYRDKAWDTYHSNEKYLNLMKDKFGQKAVDELNETKKVKLKKEDLIFDEAKFKKDNPNLFSQNLYKTPKSYVPKHVSDELEASKAKIVELNEEIEELKKEIELLRSLNEEC